MHLSSLDWTITDRETLMRFFRLVRPAGPGWGPIRAQAQVTSSPDSLPQNLLGWMLGCLFVYSALFGTGSFLYGKAGLGAAWLAVFVATGTGLASLLPRLWSKEPAA